MLTKNAQEFAQKLHAQNGTSGRLLALDLGERHVGVAISNSARSIATPRSPIKRHNSWQTTENHILKLLDEDDIKGLVIGWPLNMSGTTEGSADKAESLAHLLATASNLPTLLFDERLTTSGAETLLFDYRTPNSRQTRASKKSIKPVLDSTAATLILDTALGAMR